MKRSLTIATTIAIGAGIALVGITPAQAHTPNITASCDGVVFSATNYESDKKNVWAITLNGEYQTGTFGKEFHQTFPVAQDGKITTGKAQITAVDQKPEYTLGIEINVGPCGVAPVETKANVAVTPEVCNGDVGTVALEGENVTWKIVNDFETAAGPAGTVIEGVPSGMYKALANGELAESVDNPRVYGHSTFTAVPDAGFVIVGDSVFEVDTVKAVCAIVPPTVIPAPPTLAATGAESAIPLGIAGLLLFIGGFMFSLARRFRVVAGSGE